jgi:hypothetical protein
MKTTIIALALILTQTVFAGTTTNLQNGDISVYNAQASIIKVSPYCPSTPGGMHCQAVGSTVTILVHLKGCADRVLSYYSTFAENHGTGELSLGVIAVATKQSTAARCFAAPTQTITVSIPSNDKVELKSMNFNGQGDLQF